MTTSGRAPAASSSATEPTAPTAPRQAAAGSAAGKAQAVPASAPRAGRGTGHTPGVGDGELPAYAPPVAQRAQVVTPHLATSSSTAANQPPQITGQYPPQN